MFGGLMGAAKGGLVGYIFFCKGFFRRNVLSHPNASLRPTEHEEFARGDFKRALSECFLDLDRKLLLKSRKSGWQDGTTALTAVIVGMLGLSLAHIM
jgi:hypothetical protein